MDANRKVENIVYDNGSKSHGTLIHFGGDSLPVEFESGMRDIGKIDKVMQALLPDYTGFGAVDLKMRYKSVMDSAAVYWVLALPEVPAKLTGSLGFFKGDVIENPGRLVSCIGGFRPASPMGGWETFADGLELSDLKDPRGVEKITHVVMTHTGGYIVDGVHPRRDSLVPYHGGDRRAAYEHLLFAMLIGEEVPDPLMYNPFETEHSGSYVTFEGIHDPSIERATRAAELVKGLVDHVHQHIGRKGIRSLEGLGNDTILCRDDVATLNKTVNAVSRNIPSYEGAAELREYLLPEE